MEVRIYTSCFPFEQLLELLASEVIPDKAALIISRVSNPRCEDPINPTFHEARHTAPPDGIDKDQVVRPLDPFLRTKDKGIFLHPLSVTIAKDRIKVLFIETDRLELVAI